MPRTATRVLPILVVLATLAVATPAHAAFSANDPRDSNTKMDLRTLSSRIVQGSIGGHPAKIVRFRVMFDKAVPWANLHDPDLLFAMDTESDPRADYRLDIFRRVFPGDPHKMHCFLRDASLQIILGDADVVGYSAIGKVATCAFPKSAMRVRRSGVVKWAVQSHYAADAGGTDFRIDDAPGVAPFFYPHL